MRDMIWVEANSISVLHLFGDCSLIQEDLVIPREMFAELITLLYDVDVEKATAIIKKINANRREVSGEVFVVLKKAFNNGSVERAIAISNEMVEQKSKDTRFIAI